MSFSCGRVVQFVIVGLLHRKRSEEADDDERTTIRSQRERSELRTNASQNIAAAVPAAGWREAAPNENQNENHQRKRKPKTKIANENLKRKPHTRSQTVLELERKTKSPG